MTTHITNNNSHTHTRTKENTDMTNTTRASFTDATTLSARNADLADIFALLQERNARRLDLVAPASQLMAWKGNLHVKGADPVITADGVSLADGQYTPNNVAIEGIADKTGVPVKYLRTLHADRPDLFDANVNGLLRGGIDSQHVVAEPDTRSFMLRTFKPADPSQPGILRALLSDRYRVIDDLDILMSVLDGIQAAGVTVRIDSGDLTERRMRVRVVCEEVKAYAPTLLKGYRSPYSGQTGDENPTVFAGFEISNSETGHGSFAITPRLVVQVCNNGMTLTKDVMRSVHLGSKLDHGIVRYSEDTLEKNLELTRSVTADAVRTLLDVDYVTKAIERLERHASEEVTSVDAVKDITKRAGFTQSQIDSTLDFFVRGGQMSTGGIVNAATAAAQALTDGDDAADLETKAMALLAA